MSSGIQRINPDGLFKNPAFSQIVTTTGNGKTIYIGGQNAVNQKGELVGKGDIKAQTKQVLENIKIALKASKADFEHIVKMTLNIVDGQDLKQAFEAYQEFFPNNPNPSVVTGLFVAGLTHPDYLLEIDLIAFVAG